MSDDTERRLQRIEKELQRCSCKSKYLGRFCDAWGCATIRWLVEEIRRLQREREKK